MSIPEYHCTEGHAIQPKDWEQVEALRAALKAMVDRFGVAPGNSIACDNARSLLTPNSGDEKQ